MRETVLAIADELSEDDLVLRYRVAETDDGFDSAEGSFTICSFWLVSTLVMIGELDRARALREKPLSYASPLQLYAEEIDPHTGRHLGNFPQALTHLALINAVVRGMKAMERKAKAGCDARWWDSFTERTAPELVHFGYPVENEWKAGVRTVVCLGESKGRPLTRSLLR